MPAGTSVLVHGVSRRFGSTNRSTRPTSELAVAGVSVSDGAGSLFGGAVPAFAAPDGVERAVAPLE